MGISAFRLHRRRLRVPGGGVERSSLFPCFNAAGEVRWVLLVNIPRAKLQLFRWAPRRFRKPVFGGLRIAEGAAGKDIVRQSDASILEGLWHFDPWWVLKEAPFGKHPAADALRATNCAGLLKPSKGRLMHQLMYARDLGKVERVVFKKGEQVHGMPWKPSLLPTAYSAPSRGRAARRRWRLAPVWGPGPRST